MSLTSEQSESFDLPLIVLSGHHKGARLRIDPAGIIIGGTEECTAMLWDKSAQDVECVLSPLSNGSLDVLVKKGLVSINQKLISEGETASLRRSSELKIGDVRLALGATDQDAEAAIKERHASRLTYALVAGVAGVIALSAVTGAAGGWANVRPYFDALPAAPQKSPLSGEEAQTAFLERMHAAGLSALSINSADEGSVFSVQGKVSFGDTEKWDETKRWFDGRYGADFTLIDNVIRPETEIVLPFKIAGVTELDRPLIILHDGTRYGEGEKLPGGWTLRAVGQENIEIERDGRMLSLPF